MKNERTYLNCQAQGIDMKISTSELKEKLRRNIKQYTPRIILLYYN